MFFTDLSFLPTRKPAILQGMVFLEKLSLVQFKNYATENFHFTTRITGICGLNGVGKTNLLDAIYYLCFTKSYFGTPDAQLVQKEHQGWRVQGIFKNNQNKVQEVKAIFRENGKKEISLDGEVYTRISHHVGRFPAVIIAPDDINIINGAAEERRKMADALLCQLDADYLQQLMACNKLLQQRNSLLKQMADMQKKQDAVLDILDEQLATKSAFIYQRRVELLTPYLQKATEHYQLIAGTPDAIALSFQSQLHTLTPVANMTVHYGQLLQKNRPRDLALSRTTTGIHRDDLQFLLQDRPFRQMASQGQRKSLLFALKLTEFEMLQEAKGAPPILLLDDIFEKLDDERMQNLLQEVCIEKQGQVFITDTQEERLKASLEKINAPYAIIALS